jgi:hypothetical protein
VYSVWEPILPTDWRKPGGNVLRRISDHRARQFWDAGHAIAAALKTAAAKAEMKPACCKNRGNFWDMAAVYPPGAHWGESMPAPAFLDGTVFRVADRLEASITEALRSETGSVHTGTAN